MKKCNLFYLSGLLFFFCRSAELFYRRESLHGGGMAPPFCVWGIRSRKNKAESQPRRGKICRGCNSLRGSFVFQTKQRNFDKRRGMRMSTKPIHSTAATRFDLSAAALHILAMVLMLMDHLWATLLPAQEWLTCAGRVAFPIFAFMAVEGYFHTHDLKKYTLRLLLFALLSEVPFDLMYGGTWFYPVHQNVIWTLLLGILGIHLMETVRKKQKTALYLLVSALVVVAGAVLGTLGMVDYYGAGVLTVFIFYFFHGRKWWCLLGQLAALYWVNVELLGGLMYPIQLFGMDFELCQQGLALLALVPIWLYRGRQGYHSKPFQYACYAFYPVHMLLLALVLNFVNR